jgi:hypothetical protein
VSLLEQALVQLQSDNKEIQILSVALLDTLTAVMAPTTYLEGMASLLHHQNASICRKVSFVCFSPDEKIWSEVIGTPLSGSLAPMM